MWLYNNLVLEIISQNTENQQYFNTNENAIFEKFYECPKCYYRSTDPKKLQLHKIKTDNFKICAKISRILYVERDRTQKKLTQSEIDNYRNEWRKLCDASDTISSKVKNDIKFKRKNDHKSCKFKNETQSFTIMLKCLKIGNNCNIICNVCWKLFETVVETLKHFAFKHFLHEMSKITVQFYDRDLKIKNDVFNNFVCKNVLKNNEKLTKDDILLKNYVIITPSDCHYNNLKYTYDLLDVFTNDLVPISKLIPDNVVCSYIMCYPCLILFFTTLTARFHFKNKHNVSKNDHIQVVILNEISEIPDAKKVKFHVRLEYTCNNGNEKLRFDDILILSPTQNCYVSLGQTSEINDSSVDSMTCRKRKRSDNMTGNVSTLSTDDICEVDIVDTTEDRDITALLHIIDEEIAEIKSKQ